VNKNKEEETVTSWQITSVYRVGPSKVSIQTSIKASAFSQILLTI
jgi:hypothetical protein